MRTIKKWWSGHWGAGRKFIYLRTGQVWVVEIPRGDGSMWTRTFHNEPAALAFIEAAMKRAGGEWTYHKELDP